MSSQSPWSTSVYTELAAGVGERQGRQALLAVCCLLCVLTAAAVISLCSLLPTVPAGSRRGSRIISQQYQALSCLRLHRSLVVAVVVVVTKTATSKRGVVDAPGVIVEELDIQLCGSGSDRHEAMRGGKKLTIDWIVQLAICLWLQLRMQFVPATTGDKKCGGVSASSTLRAGLEFYVLKAVVVARKIRRYLVEVHNRR